MITIFRNALSALLCFTILTGVAYPLAVLGIAKLVFRSQAEGSVVERQGKVLGSRLIGQNFSDPKYFWGRPSATSPYPNATLPSGAANKAAGSEELRSAVKHRLDALRAADPDNVAPIPIELLAASGSGIDPEISPAAAAYQVQRVARHRGLSEETVRTAVDASTSGRQLGLLGEPRVNVLELNLRLDGRW